MPHPPLPGRADGLPLQARAPDFSSAELRAALGQFATGVTVITCRDADGQPVGVTANSFNSVSLDPPLVLWSLALTASSRPAMTRATHFAVNILAAEQRPLAEQFARRLCDRFAGIGWRPGASGAPLLDGCAATFECFNRARYEEGDHLILIGQVERCARRAGARPLIFHSGGFTTALAPEAA